jgi:hypothetical protein
VVEFRQAWKDELARIISGNKVSEEFIERLNRLLADTFQEKLELEGKNGFCLVRSISQLHGKKLALAILSRQIAVFLAESNLSHLRRCAQYHLMQALLLRHHKKPSTAVVQHGDLR